MTKKQLLINKVKSEFPEFKFKKVKLVTQGWDHDVLIMDDKFVFRFAKDKIYKNSFIREVKFLKYLSKISNLPVPSYTLLSKDKTFGGYPIIKGKQLTPKIYQSLPKTKKLNFAKDMGKFLTILHTIPILKAKKYGFKKYEAQTERKIWLKNEYWPKMKKYLSEKEQMFIIGFLENSLKSQSKAAKVLGHFDLCHDHIFTSRDGTITGIIDFGDMNISDPAYEFSGFQDYDKEIVHKIYKYYRGPKDKDFLKRSYEYYVHRYIFLMYDGKVRRKEEGLWKAAKKEIANIMKHQSNYEHYGRA